MLMARQWLRADAISEGHHFAFSDLGWLANCTAVLH